MPYQVVQLKCSNCGAPVALEQKVCGYCDQPIIITNYNTVASMPGDLFNEYKRMYTTKLSADPENAGFNSSLAFCYMKLKLYDKAIAAFEKATDDDCENPDVYFNLAICLLKGQKPFCHMRPTINKITEYLNAAISLEEKGIYYYLLAYIKYDYFARKYLNTSPNYKDLLMKAKQIGYTQNDAQQLFLQLGVEKPNIF